MIGFSAAWPRRAEVAKARRARADDGDERSMASEAGRER